MNIFITGATGEVGFDLVNFLLSNNNNYIYANYRSDKDKKIFKHAKLNWIKHDFKEVLQQRFKIDLIINCIATHGFSKKKDFPNMINSNIVSIQNIHEFALRNKAKLILNLSTISVYGCVKIDNLSEKYLPIKQNDLGMTKFLGEEMLKKSKNYINIRLPGILTMNNNFQRPWIKTIILKLKQNKKVELYNINKKFNNMIDTKEITKFINHLIKNRLYHKKINTNFNLAASNPIKLSQIINIIKKKYLSKSKLIVKKNNVQNYTIDNTKIIKTLKFYPSAVKDIILRNL